MKRKIALIVLAILIAVTCVTLIACERKDRNVGPAGVYNFYSVTGTLEDGSKVTIKAGVPTTVYDETVTIEADAVTLTLDNDNTWTMEGNMMGESLNEEGTWIKENGKILLTNAGETIEATLINGILSFSREPVEISFKYVKSVDNPLGGIGAIGGIGGITGTYKLYSMTMKSNGVSYTIQAGKPTSINGITVNVNADAVTMEVRADNTFTMKGNMMGETMNQDGTWEKKNDKYYFTAEGDTIEVTIKNGFLTINDDDMNLQLKYYGSSTSGGSSILGNIAVGTYKFSSMKIMMDAVTYEIKADVTTDFMGTDMTIRKNDITLELKSNGSFVMNSNVMGSSSTQNGTWELDLVSDELTLTDTTGSQMKGTQKNGVVTIYFDGLVLTLKK